MIGKHLRHAAGIGGAERFGLGGSQAVGGMF